MSSADSPPATVEALLQHIRHELRTPMNAILGYSEMWLEDAEEAGFGHIAPLLTLVQQSGTEALGHVSRLVDPDRLGADFDPEFQLDGLAEDVQQALGRSIEGIPATLDRIRSETSGLSSSDLGDLHADLERIGDAVQRLQVVMTEVFDTNSVSMDHTAAVTAEVNLAVSGPSEQLEGHVLVVDDELGNQQVLKRRLERMGCTVETVGSGPEALARLLNDTFDLVLLDVIMPGMTGYEVLRSIKGMAETAHVPVVMISALDQLDSVLWCLELGADDYLPKPFNPVLLRARVGSSLARKRARDQEIAFQRQLEGQKRRVDALLHAIFPDRIAAELKEHGTVQAREHQQVSVLFCDIVGFTDHCAQNEASVVRDQLQELTEAFEELCLAFRLEKIKTIGDSFMAAGGLRPEEKDAADRAARCGLEMIRQAPLLSAGWQVRVALNTGPVIAGVVGRRKYQYDLWGDTVNTAARIEALTSSGELWVSPAVVEQLGEDWAVRSMGVHPLKGRGELELFRVLSPTSVGCLE